MNPKPKEAAAITSAALMVEDVIGCKWTVAVLCMIRDGVHRPGAIQHGLEGLSKKVLAERLRKLVRLGILQKKIYAEVPPHVEYRLSKFGTTFCAVLDVVADLQREIDRTAPR